MYPCDNVYFCFWTRFYLALAEYLTQPKMMDLTGFVEHDIHANVSYGPLHNNC